jgi:thiol-disulfide isomerase/thioredoxin
LYGSSSSELQYFKSAKFIIMKIKVSLFLLIVLFTEFCGAQSQSKSPTLAVGDSKSDLSAFRWMKGTGITHFQKGKIYLVEFGATWCIPCRRTIPHLIDLQEKMKDSLTVISIFTMEFKKDKKDTSYLKTVRNYLANIGSPINYRVGVDDPDGTLEHDWLQAANLVGIPYAFLIDKTGRIAWIGLPLTNTNELESAIAMVQQKNYTTEQAIQRDKQTRAIAPPNIDILKPMYINDNGGKGDHFLFRSILTDFRGEKAPYVDYVFSPYYSKFTPMDLPSPALVQQIGVSIDKLYYLAYADTIGQMIYSRRFEDNEYPDTSIFFHARNRYGNFWYKAIVEVSDTTPFKIDFRSITNRYNYSLIVADERSTAAYLQKAMRRDLDTYFGYRVSVEERMMPYWKVVASPIAKKKLKAAEANGKFYAVRHGDSLVQYHNAQMLDIMIRLIYPFSYTNMSYGEKPMEEAPFIDETGLDGPIDYDIYLQREAKPINERKDWNAALAFLHRLGLDLQRGERLTKVVVIRDPVL